MAQPARPVGAPRVPAHLTLRSAFVPPGRIDQAVTDRLRTLFAAAEPFTYQLGGPRRFEDRVRYLAPSPAERFGRLTERLVAAFPEHLPDGGRSEAVVPHLTVADGGSPAELDEAGAAVPGPEHVPIECRAVEAVLMSGGTGAGSWQVLERFDLGPDR